MKYFGKPHPAPVYRDIERAETPVGCPCGHCDEAIQADDDGWLLPCGGALDAEGNQVAFAYSTFHRECFLRTIFGSVAHIEHRCGCYVPGSDEADPPGMTIREAALAACTALNKKWSV